MSVRVRCRCGKMLSARSRGWSACVVPRHKAKPGGAWCEIKGFKLYTDAAGPAGAVTRVKP